jgi:hypothetical protein
MIGPTRTFWRVRLLLTGFTIALALAALTTVSVPAQARVWVSVAAPCCGYAYPGPYYGYGYPPPPYAYAPPPGYYPPPPDAGVPGAGAPGAYPPAGPAPSAYTPDAPASGYPPSAPTTAYEPAPTAGAPAAVTYTNKPAFTNAAGQTCRQYKTTDASGGHPIDVYGTACRQADGQWRVVN